MTSQVLAKGTGFSVMRPLNPGARAPSISGITALKWGTHSGQRLNSVYARYTLEGGALMEREASDVTTGNIPILDRTEATRH